MKQKKLKALERPSVSIVVCTYNGEKFLREQLDSLLAQTYPVQEMLVQDDGSTDATWQILEEYAARDARFVPVRNEGPHGVNANFLSALRRARGELIAVCDQDDIWEPDKIELQVAALGDGLFCTCHSEQFGADGQTLPLDRRVPNLHPVRLMFRSIPGHTVLMRRELVERLPLANEIYSVSFYDVALALAAAVYGPVAFVDKVLVHQRRYEEAASFNALSTRRTRATVSNGFYTILWSLRHYRRVRPFIHRMYRSRAAFLAALPAALPETRNELLLLCRLQQARGPVAYVRLTAFFVRHRHHLFQVEGGGAVNFLRALLFSFLQAWNFRGWLDRQA